MSAFIDLLPIGLILRFASAYISGKNAQEALSVAHDVYQQNQFTSTLVLLDESASSSQECDEHLTQYLSLIDLLKKNPLPTQDRRKALTISFKSSMFCIRPTAGISSNSTWDDGFTRIARVVEYAFKNNIQVTLDAEDYIWSEFQMDTYTALRDAGYSNLGAVLQTRLFRTQQDIKRFSEGNRVRLVIGIYEEPSNIAYTDKKQMKDLLISYSRELLDKGVYVEFATHDEDYVRKLITEVILPSRITPDKFETQFLFGVPRFKLEQALSNGEYFKQFADENTADRHYLDNLIHSGILVRLYSPFGPDASAGPYCKRRVKENPNFIIYGLKNLARIR